MKRSAICTILLLSSLGALGTAADPLEQMVRINEVCWAGSSHSPGAEWIELVNLSSNAVDLSGWRLVSSDGAPDIRLNGAIGIVAEGDPFSGYYLLERDSDDAVSGIAADALYAGALTDAGETLFLYDAAGRLVDTANASSAGGANAQWVSGTDASGDPAFASMERIDPQGDDHPSNWATCAIPLQKGEGSLGFGTPRAENGAFNLPPSARLRVDPAVPQPDEPVLFDASQSTDPNDTITGYTWEFGDGDRASGGVQSVSHTYARPGDYLVALTIQDSKGATSRFELAIRVRIPRPPLADYSLVSESGRRALVTLDPIRFQDESSDVTCNLIAWEWDFGDGETSTERSPSHAYARSGSYEVTLAVTDEQGNRAVRTQSVEILNRPPAAFFVPETVTPNENAACSFDASGSIDPDGTIATYIWDFDGDGLVDQRSDEPRATVTFDRGGRLVTALRVVDELGEASLPFSLPLDVNHAPATQFSLSSFDVNELDCVYVEDLSADIDGVIVERTWDFGDGIVARGQTASHVYRASGTYHLALTAIDDRGATATARAYVSVTNLPPVAFLTSALLEQPTGATFVLDATASRDLSPDGRLTEYQWDFDGDGTTDEQTTTATVDHAYADNGTYFPSVRVVDNLGATSTAAGLLLTVTNRPPSVITVSSVPLLPRDGEAIRFASSAEDADGTLVDWLWDFGDGASSTEESPTHTYEDDGIFTVVVSVSDNDGARSASYSATVEVVNAVPVATFVAASVGGSPGTVAFDASGSYDPSPHGRLAFVWWDFGDGTTCPGTKTDCGTDDPLQLSHCYSAAGSYIVTLTLIDDQGALVRTGREITVSR
jgi:PKD repeat protein